MSRKIKYGMDEFVYCSKRAKKPTFESSSIAVFTMKKITLGVDIGGTNTKFGLVDQSGKILAKGNIRTGNFATPESFSEGLYLEIQKLIASYSEDITVQRIGVCAPDANYFTGNIEHAPNLPWKGIVPLKNIIAEKFSVPCVLCNDANAAAMGEMKYGATKNIKDFIMITLGTGVGSGIVSDGKLVYGHDSFAGELGHTMIKLGGRKHWSTGLEGTLEAYASATGIAITALEMRTENPGSLLNQYPEKEMSSKVVHHCALKGDPTAIEVLRYTGELLGRAFANFVMFSSPKAIVLFGGATQAGDFLLNPAKHHMEKSLLPVFRGKVKLLLSELDSADAAILGATVIANI